MVLFLGGGGDIETSVEIDQKFFHNIKKNDKIIYIPVACDFTTYEKCLEWFYSLVSRYVKMPKSNITMLLEDYKITDLREYKAIYIGGGNTYKLLDYVRKNDLEMKFKDYLNGDGIIFGGSAGAIIFGKTIETVIEEKENYPDNKSLNLLGDYAIRCHYQESEDDFFKALSQSLNIPIIAMPEDSGIIFDGKCLELIGKPIVFNNGIKNNKYPFEIK